MVSWLPNQLGAVLEWMVEVYQEAGDLSEVVVGDGGVLKDMMARVCEQRSRLAREVERWCRESGESGEGVAEGKEHVKCG